ncbi:lasso peptide biosynthesis PqqD family chaperone [Virgibacillus necropolis]|uniref:PqqD family protein n=1 Tax=Virgibacillus necropolis TaxID=163877 RepID=A0A221MEB7_9BACI|nr:lasso peptide biosynthesis PqqD family chaperone [Virgibacillus necropolis]ASN05981.1 PqqD family protein [Virgibacillus necropolis]
MIKNQSIVSQEQGNIVSDMDGEKVMLSIHNGKYYNLGEMGGEIWEQIKDPTTTEDLIAFLMKHYEVKQDECWDQVLSFLNLLLDERLIKIEDGAAS